MNYYSKNNRKILPKVRDSLSFIYLEYVSLHKENNQIVAHHKKEECKSIIPCAQMSLLMLGPGTSITHSVISTCSDLGCTITWVGSEGNRFYAYGSGKTLSSYNILKQIKLYEDKNLHMNVVRKMYEIRFKEEVSKEFTLDQLRGYEGNRVRTIYKQLSEKYNVQWDGRNYDHSNWNNSDNINKAISAANSCLYGIAHSAIVALGYSPAIGFIHTGNSKSFVLDISDLYKHLISLPIAFSVVSENNYKRLDSEIRKQCRDYFSNNKFLSQIVKDIQYILEEEKEIQKNNIYETSFYDD